MGRLFKNYPNKITQSYKEGVHDGVDVVGKSDNNVSALDYIVAHSDGTVTEVIKNYNTTDKSGNSYGNYVKIQHSNGYYTLYAHMKYTSVVVSVGDQVKKGQVIGYMGNTGHSFGAHLHFEVRNEQNVRINPTPYIDADLPTNTTHIVCQTVTVKKGDSLWALAEKYLGTGQRYRELMELNGLTSTTIYPGLELKLSEVNEGAAVPEETTSTYTVVKGDTLWGIAQKKLGNGNRYKEIMELSDISSTTIYVGQVLILPVV